MLAEVLRLGVVVVADGIFCTTGKIRKVCLLDADK
jgi:hypothetical protein